MNTRGTFCFRRGEWSQGDVKLGRADADPQAPLSPASLDDLG